MTTNMLLLGNVGLAALLNERGLHLVAFVVAAGSLILWFTGLLED